MSEGVPMNYRAMQALHAERLDAHDRAIAAIDQRLDRIALLQEKTQAGMRDLEAIVGTLAKTTDELVRALTAAGRTNGKPEAS